jgi:hypothetical protein
MRSNGFPLRSPHTVLAKFLLRSDFVESQLTPLDSFARVSDAALFQNLLDLTVFAKGSVQRDECELDIAWQLKLRIPHIDVDNVRAE